MRKFFVLSLFGFINFSFIAQNLEFKDDNFLAAILELGIQVDTNGDQIIQKSEADSVKNLKLMEKNIQSMDDAYLFPNLEELVLTRNQITEVRLFGFQKLKKFYCAVNPVKVAIVKDLPVLTDLTFNFCTTLESLTLENLPNLASFSAQDNKIQSFDATVFPKLKHLSLSDNKIPFIDISKNPEMVQLMIDGNPIKELDIRFNPKMRTHILYIDKTVKIIATPQQEKEIKKSGTAEKLIEIVR